MPGSPGSTGLDSCGNGCGATPVTSPGTPAPARRPGEQGSPSAIRCNGGYTFAEDPHVAAPEARIIWHADLDPGTIRAAAIPGVAGDPDSLDPDSIGRWLTVVNDADGCQHAVLSDGLRHIRVDIETGRLIGGAPVVLHFRLEGIASAARHLLPLRQFLQVVRDRRFPVRLFPPMAGAPRAIALLRVRDALDDHASQREIAQILFADEQPGADAQGRSDSLRSRVRRLVRDVRKLTNGGYRALMAGKVRQDLG